MSNKKHYLQIQTGGTFGSMVTESKLFGLGGKNILEYEIIKKLSAERNIIWDIKTPFMLLSENMTIDKLEHLINYIRDNMGGYDGVIITHGSDSLAYTVYAAAYSLGELSLPIAFVVADKPLGNPESNGIPNFIKALDFLDKGEHKIFVPWGTDKEIITPEPHLKAADSIALSPHIIQLMAYPGMDYGKIDYTDVQCIIHRSYHTGMICTAGEKENVNTLFTLTQNRIPVYLTGGSSKTTRYEWDLAPEAPLYIANDISPEEMYAKALVAYGNPGLINI